MRVTVTTPPTEEPVTYAEATATLLVEHDEDEARIEGLITAARVAAERATGRSFVTQTLTVRFDAREMSVGFVLPYGPVQSVTSFTTYDTEGTGTLTTSSDYQLAGDFISSHPGGGYWDVGRSLDTAQVVYVAGYGAASAVPTPIKEWIKAKVKSLYEGEPMLEGEAYLLEPFVSYQYG